MFSFDFLPRAEDSSWRPEGRSHSYYQRLKADDFVFHHFKSDVLICDGANEILLKTPGLPVIDFVLMLAQLRRELSCPGVAEVESSQSQDSIRGARGDNFVEVSYSFSHVVSRVDLGAFDDIAKSALRSALELFNSVHPGLEENEYLADISKLIFRSS